MHEKNILIILAVVVVIILATVITILVVKKDHKKSNPQATQRYSNLRSGSNGTCLTNVLGNYTKWIQGSCTLSDDPGNTFIITVDSNNNPKLTSTSWSTSRYNFTPTTTSNAGTPIAALRISGNPNIGNGTWPIQGLVTDGSFQIQDNNGNSLNLTLN